MALDVTHEQVCGHETSKHVKRSQVVRFEQDVVGVGGYQSFARDLRVKLAADELPPAEMESKIRELWMKSQLRASQSEHDKLIDDARFRHAQAEAKNNLDSCGVPSTPSRQSRYTLNPSHHSNQHRLRPESSVIGNVDKRFDRTPTETICRDESSSEVQQRDKGNTSNNYRRRK